jgi:hypothetical protein
LGTNWAQSGHNARCGSSEVASGGGAFFSHRTSKRAQKNPRQGAGFHVQRIDFIMESGGYGWTRTTDPVIMSDVL